MTSPSVNVLSPQRLAPRTGAAALTSVLLGAFGLWLIVNPDRNPLVDPSQALLRVLIGTRGCTLLLLALAVVGAVTGALGLRSGRSARSVRRPALLGVAVAQLLGLGIALQSVSTIALAGYLMALALPVALVCFLVQVVRRYRRLRWPVLLVALALLVAGYVSGALRGEHLEALARALAGGFARQATALLLVAAVAVSAAAWALVLNS